MLLVRVGWKSSTPTTDVAVCNTSGWAKLGQYYDGGGVSSNGGGGVLVAVFWKVATSASETNPTVEFDDATAPTPGAYCAVTYTKGASETWVDPVGASGAIAAATSYSATMSTHVSATAGDMLDAFAVTNDNTTLTVPTVSQTGVTFDTVTEYPATALSSATSNDISADGCNRLATSGTSSAAAVVSGTNSVADPGAAWVTRLRVKNGISLTAGLTPSGARPVMKGKKALTGALSSLAGAVTKKSTMALAGALSGLAGALSRTSQRSVSLSGTVSFSGASARALRALREFTADLTPSVTFLAEKIESLAEVFDASLSFVTDASRKTARSLVATLTLAGAIAALRRIPQALTASLSFTGEWAKKPMKTLAAALPFLTGALTKKVTRVFTAGLTSAGSVTKAMLRSAAGGASVVFLPTATRLKRVGQVLTASLSFTGTWAKTPRKVLAATLSPAAALQRFVQTSADRMTATLTPAGALIRKTFRSLAADLTSSASMTAERVATQLQEAFTATLTFVGTWSRLSTLHRAFTATQGFVGAVWKRAPRDLSGSVAFSGVVGRTTKKWLTATQGFAGSVATFVRKRFAAALTLGGALVRSGAKSEAFAATVSFVGAAKARAGKTFSAEMTFSGQTLLRSAFRRAWSVTLTPAGSIVRSVRRALAATLAPTGSIRLATRRALDAMVEFQTTLRFRRPLHLDGTLSFVTTLTRWSTLHRAFTAMLAPAGSIVRRTFRALTAALSPSGAIASLKHSGGVWLTASLTFAGSAVRKTQHRMTAASLSPSAVFSRMRIRHAVMTATLTFSGAIRKRGMKVLAAAAAFSGAVQRRTRKLLEGTLITNATFWTQGSLKQVFTATLGLAGSIAKRSTRTVAGSVAFAGTITRKGFRSFAAALAPAGTFVKQATLQFLGSLAGVYARVVDAKPTAIVRVAPKAVVMDDGTSAKVEE
jgi:hypothetical protein